jgi:hypothetical protein
VALIPLKVIDASVIIAFREAGGLTSKMVARVLGTAADSAVAA